MNRAKERGRVEREKSESVLTSGIRDVSLLVRVPLFRRDGKGFIISSSLICISSPSCIPSDLRPTRPLQILRFGGKERSMSLFFAIAAIPVHQCVRGASSRSSVLIVLRREGVCAILKNRRVRRGCRSKKSKLFGVCVCVCLRPRVNTSSESISQRKFLIPSGRAHPPETTDSSQFFAWTNGIVSFLWL